MSTTVRSNKIPRNHRKPNMKSKTQDAVSPSVRGLKTIIPSTVGIAERARREYQKASIIVDTIKLVHAARKSGDARIIAATKPFMPLVKKALDQLGRTVDSLARETAAASNAAKPEAQAPYGSVEAPALVEGDPDVAAGLIGDQAFTNYTPEALERRAARNEKHARLGYAIERGDTAVQHEILFGGPRRECEDPYAALGHRGSQDSAYSESEARRADASGRIRENAERVAFKEAK